MMVIGHLVKIDFRSVKTDTIIKYIYLYYSEQMTESENKNDHFDLDHFDRVSNISKIFLILEKSLKEKSYLCREKQIVTS